MVMQIFPNAENLPSLAPCCPLDKSKFLNMATTALLMTGLYLNSQPHFFPQTIWCLMLLKLFLFLQSFTIFCLHVVIYAPAFCLLGNSCSSFKLQLKNPWEVLPHILSHHDHIFFTKWLLQLIYTSIIVLITLILKLFDWESVSPLNCEHLCVSYLCT